MGDNRFTGDMFRISRNEPNVKLGESQAKALIKKYRWIYANASCKDLEEAKEEALKLSNAVGSPLILVYLSRHVFFDTHRRNTYPDAFRNSINTVINEALASREFEYKEDPLLVSAKSYSVHQVLHAINGFETSYSSRPAYNFQPRILLIGISPAFGAFGNKFSSNVKQYVQDVRYTNCKYCMIASNDDGITWKAGGAARKWGGGRKRHKGDNNVGRAMDENRGHNVKIITLEGAKHSMDDYLKYGLVGAMRRSVDLCGFRGTCIADILNPDLARVASGKGDRFW